MVNALNKPSKGCDNEDYADETNDMFQPYNIVASKSGGVNEWRDRSFEWDVLCNHLNQ